MKFYEMTPAERRIQLQQEGVIDTVVALELAETTGLPEDLANHLIENQISQFTLPMGLVRNLPVNGQLRQVPLVTEEPSVVAAANNGARIARLAGGVTATSEPNRVIGQVIFKGLKNPEAATTLLATRRDDLFEVAAAAHPSIVRRGGGLLDITSEQNADYWTVLLTVDPQEAMGANITNTITEALANTLRDWLNHEPLAAILSNQAIGVTKATMRVPYSALKNKTTDGETIAKHIADLSAFARLDTTRAATHNKGTMNGVLAAVLATGNDTRAVNTAVGNHLYRSHRQLGEWHIEGDELVGELIIPLPVGLVGGAISALPAAQNALSLGGYKNSEDYRNVIAAVGLVQNLSALRALVGPGIQAGHMRLQANNLAISVGAKPEEIAPLVARLDLKKLSTETAALELERMRKEGNS